MFNLLPQEEQLSVDHEYRLRLAATGLLFLAALSTVAAIALIPSLFLSYQKEAVILKRETALKEEIALGAKDNLTSVLRLTGKKVAALSAETADLYSYRLIGNITHSKSAGIKITGVSIKRAEDGGRDVAIMGEAKNREALLSFARILEQEKIFTDVSVPVSSFASAADINFSILAKTSLAKKK